MKLINKKIIVSVSSGPDSMALLHYLHKKNYVIACYINHKQRPKENIKEIELIKNFCNIYKIKFFLREINLSKIEYKSTNKQNFFRKERYNILIGLADLLHFKYIATAHHKDDQFETIFMKQIKYCNSFKNYSIIDNYHLKNKIILRPFLKYTKKELINYCNKNKIKYFIDSSNLKNNYFRNKVRNIITPIIINENNNFVDNYINYINENLYFYHYVKNDIEKQIKSIKEDILEIEVLKLFISKKDKYFKFIVIKIILEKYLKVEKKINRKIINDILKVIFNKNNKIKVNLYRNTYFYVQYNKIILYKKLEEKTIKKQLLLKYGKNYFNENLLLYVKDFIKKDITLLDNRNGEKQFLYLKKDIFIQGLFLDYPKSSDKIKIKNGTKKINRLYIDKKIKKELRYITPVLLNIKREIIYDILTLSISYDCLIKNINFNYDKNAFVIMEFYNIIN